MYYGKINVGDKIEQNYSLRIDTKNYKSSDIDKEICEDVRILASLGYQDVLNKTYNVVINNRAIKILGYCKREALNRYTITINAKAIAVCPPEEVHNIIMHEVCHSVDGCMNHGPNWKAVAEKVNSNYQFTPITRTSDDEAYQAVLKSSYKHQVTCERCGNTSRYIRMTSTIKACIAGHARCGRCGGMKFSYKAL